MRLPRHTGFVALVLLGITGCARWTLESLPWPNERTRALLTTGTELRLEFAGLVDLVSDGSENPSQAWILIPNASRPVQGDHYHTGHQARLILREGTPVGEGWTELKRCKSSWYTPKEVTGFPLDSWELRLADDIISDPLFLDRSTQNSLDSVTDLDTLVAKINSWDGGDLGRIPSDMLSGAYVASPRRLASRVILDGGSLGTTYRWNPTGTHIGFERSNGQPVLDIRSQSMAAEIALSAITMQDEVVIELRRLSDLTELQSLRVRPSSGRRIVLRIENSPIKGSCFGHKAHFGAHFMLRPGYDDVKHVIVPTVRGISGYTGSSDDNPQCSPADNSGG